MSRPEGRKERKLVTVLFADMVGFTALAEPLDPEDVEAILEPYHTRLRSELQRFGGTVEKFVGDAVVAVFGAPVAREDDPERAVRAALAIRDWAAGEGGELEVRIAVNTGEVLLTLDADADSGEHFATGDVVNTASRLQAAAPVNGILVGEVTYRATRRVIEYREHEPVLAKGKAEPIRVWEALAAPPRLRAVRRELTPFVGRQRELDILLDALARAREERGPQLVTVMGVPGIGKSRLIEELGKAAEPDPELTWRQGRSLSYGEGVTLWALGEIVKAQAGILETDAVETAEGRLRRAVADLLADDGERRWVETHLRPLVGLGSEPEAGEERRHEAFVAWRRFFEALAEQQPLALVFEDLHWADDGVLDFLDHLVDWASGVPILIVATARPELFVRRPGWGGGKTNAVTISLSPLSDEQTARLVNALLARAVMPAEVEDVLLERASGNPLYAEEFVRLFTEHSEPRPPVPEAVQGIIAARLDTLQREEKELLQSAAVVGDVFWAGAVATLGKGERAEVEQRMHTLERKEFVRRRPRASVAAETEFAFSHALIREVAYDQITRARRAEKHSLAAKWIDSLGRPDDHAELIAHHCLRALEYGRPATQETIAAAERARGALREAGDRALALYAYAAARRFYEQALEVSPTEDAERPALLFRRAKAVLWGGDNTRVDLFEQARDALLAVGDRVGAAEAETLGALALRASGRAIDALEAAQSAAALLAGAAPSPVKAYVLANLARYLNLVADRREEAIESASTALRMAEELKRDDVKAHALNTIGMARVADGDASGIEQLEESLGLALGHGSPFELARVYNNLAAGYVAVGRLEQASATAAAVIEMREQYGLPTRWEQQLLAMYDVLRGGWERATQNIAELLAPGHAEPLREAHLRGLDAILSLARDDVEAAAAQCECALELTRGQQQDARASGSLRWLLFVRAEIALAENRPAAAHELVDAALALSARTYPNDWIVLALLLADLGRAQDVVLEAASARTSDPWAQVAAAIARGQLEQAADRLADIGARPLEAAVRLRAASALVEEGQRAEAAEQLQKALAFYRSVGATRYIREAEALLTETTSAARR
jgi:class 3 adenylate cyclase/tetratricopeptide (TPR) repeat protein